MTFPYDFGFVPSTLADDGDPLDALVLMDEPGTMGCLIDCRVIGVILGKEVKKKRQCRNDRLIVAAIPSHTHADLKRLSDLNSTLLDELEKFFINYHAEDDEKFRVLGCEGPSKARQLLEAAAARWRKTQKHEKRKRQRDRGRS
jgi:inorganic pyrophosphatase